MTSPLGKYAQLTAVLVVLATIGTWLATVVLGDPGASATLLPFATLAFGAVLGSAATVNGVKRDATALHQRLDAAGIPPAPTTEK